MHTITIYADDEVDNRWQVSCATCDEYDTEEFTSLADAEHFAEEWRDFAGGVIITQ